MEVFITHLIPGAILAEDVIGKTGKPMIPKKTVITEQHIYFLEKFLIKKVTIESRLEDGTIFSQR